MKDWSKSHNGVMLCSFEKTFELMPEVKEIIEEVYPMLELPKEEYAVDVKIHMLMPGQFPCIPNWHRDFIPRDESLKQLPKEIKKDKMFMWISGEPFTEYLDKDGNSYFKPANQWNTFGPKDMHKGTVSKIHTWRCFIRIIPIHFIHKTTINIGEIRRHTQVYLDSKKFNW